DTGIKIQIGGLKHCARVFAALHRFIRDTGASIWGASEKFQRSRQRAQIKRFVAALRYLQGKKLYLSEVLSKYLTARSLANWKRVRDAMKDMMKALRVVDSRL